MATGLNLAGNWNSKLLKLGHFDLNLDVTQRGWGRATGFAAVAVAQLIQHVLVHGALYLVPTVPRF